MDILLKLMLTNYLRDGECKTIANILRIIIGKHTLHKSIFV